jgi:radical SAM protein with 4Fe4S-binding SPASM domain
MNYIAVSVYSTDEKEYKQITGSDLFEKQFALPSMIKHENKHAIVGARCVLNRINYKSIVSIYQHAISANFDYIIFIPAVDYEGVGINLRQEEINAVKNILQSCYEIFDLSKTNADNLLSRNIDYYEKADYRKDCKISMPVCKVVEIRGNAFVNYDGGVYLCQPHIGNETYCIGNVNEKKLKDIWNSERHLHVIELLHQQFASGICKKCRSISFNKAAYEHDINPSPLLNAVKDTFI